MTPYDAAMAGVVVLGMIWGALRGITWQVASIASLVLGYLFAYPLSAQLAPHFPGEPAVARSLALMASYAVVSGGVFLAAWLVRATLRRWKFEAFDRHLGMILGGLEGAVVGLVVTLFVVSLAPQTRQPIFESPSGRVVCRVLGALEPVLPGEITAELTPFWAGTGAGTREGRSAPASKAWADRSGRGRSTPAPSPWADAREDDRQAPAPRLWGEAGGRERAASERPSRLVAPEGRRTSPSSGPWPGLGQIDADRGGEQVEEAASDLFRGLIRDGKTRATRAVNDVAGTELDPETDDPAASMIQGLIKEGEARATRAISDVAKRGLDWTSGGNERAVERR